MEYELTQEQTRYIQRLANRYVQYRKSGSIDQQDLISAANLRWWQFCRKNPELTDERTIQICFYQQTKGAMRDVVRDSSPVKVTRTMQAKLQAYQRPYTVPVEHAIDFHAGDDSHDRDQWMDILDSLRKLSEREQIILSLYFEKGYSYTEIAEIFEVSVSTITRTYQKAIVRLKNDLAEPALSAKKHDI